MQKALSIVIRCLLAIIVFAGGTMAAERDKGGKVPLPKPPPQPVEYSLKVKRGEKLTVPLKIYGSQRETLKFLIRKEPTAGRISKVQTIDRESARVVYMPPEDLSVAADRFTYAVQNSSGVSAAVEVGIEIVDDPPVLGIPDAIEFQPVLAGQTTEEELEVVNRGGGMAEGEIEVELPWRVEGTATYKLGAGESAKFKLVYAPMTGGSARRELAFTSDRTRTITLRGTAIAPISAKPESLELTVLPGDPVRVASLELLNGTSAPQTVKFTPNARFRLPDSIEVPANGRSSVSIQSVPEFVGGIAEDLVMDGGGVEVRVPVRAKPVGPVLQILTAGLDFGSSNSPQLVEVKNIGGADGYWRWDPLSPFVFAEEGFRLAPGTKKQIAVGLDNTAQGNLAATLRLVGEQQSIELPVKGALAMQSSPGARSTKPKTARPSTSRASRSDAVRTVALDRGDEGDVSFEVPPPNRGRIIATAVVLEPDRATLNWPLVGSGNYRLEERQITKAKGGGLNIDWLTYKDVECQKNGTQVTAVFKNLEPNRPYFFRVLDAAESADSVALGQVQFITPPREPLVTVTPIRGLFLALVVLVGLIVWQKKRAT